MGTLLLKNIRHLVTCDDEDRVLEQASIFIRDGVIISVQEGPVDRAADRVLDLSGMAVYPGLINTHHHLYQILTRNLPEVQGLELFDWLTRLYSIWQYLTPDALHDAALAGMGELAKYGCTTVFDHHYVFPGASRELLPAEFAAADALGMRMVVSRGSMDLSRKDGGLPPDAVVQTLDEIMRSSEETVNEWHDPNPFAMRQVVLAPCSPFSVSEDLLRESAKLARHLNVRLHTHLAETKDEERYLLGKLGIRPLEYMERLGWTGPDVWYAHGIHFNDAELIRLAETGTGVAHCPASNMKLSSGVARIPEMLRRGIPVGLAVDGSASNDGSSLADEMRIAYLLHRLTAGDEAPTGYDILKIATRGSARLLGRPALGQLTEGMAADLFAVKEDRLEFAGATFDVGGMLAAVGLKGPVDYTIIQGEVAVDQGVLPGLDEERISRRVTEHAKAMSERAAVPD